MRDIKLGGLIGTASKIETVCVCKCYVCIGGRIEVEESERDGREREREMVGERFVEIFVNSNWGAGRSCLVLVYFT